MRSFAKIKSSRNSEIILSTTDTGKSYPSREIFRSQVCLLTMFEKIKCLRKFPVYSNKLKRLQKSRYWFTGTFTNSVVDPDEMPLKGTLFAKIKTEHTSIYVYYGHFDRQSLKIQN